MKRVFKNDIVIPQENNVFEYQLDEEIKEEIGIGFHSIEHCHVYMVVQQKERKKSLSWS